MPCLSNILHNNRIIRLVIDAITRQGADPKILLKDVCISGSLPLEEVFDISKNLLDNDK